MTRENEQYIFCNPTQRVLTVQVRVAMQLLKLPRWRHIKVHAFNASLLDGDIGSFAKHVEISVGTLEVCCINSRTSNY